MTGERLTPHGLDVARPYRPIRDYALIGDCHGAALVARDGSVDWCCLGRFDADPTFCRLLDAEQGGYLSLTPVDDHAATRAYLEDTNILTDNLHNNPRHRCADRLHAGRSKARLRDA